MATIIKQAGKYLVRVRITGHKAASASFNSEKAAATWAAVTEDAIKRGIYQYRQPSAIPTLSKALATYGKTVTPHKRGEKQERYVLAVLSRLPIALRPLDQVDRVDIAQLRDAWIRARVSASTIQKRMALLSHLYTTARREWGLDVENPLRDVSKPLVNNRRTRIIMPDELQAITAQCAPALAALVRLARLSAARLGELATLQWQDVDLDARTMTFPLTKNGTARTVPLVPDALALLNGMKPSKAAGSVFGISSATATQAWRRAVVRARREYERTCVEQGTVPDGDYLRDCHFHDLRHSAITEFAERGLSTLKLASISGHKTVGMLARYTHINASRLAAELADLEGPRT